MRSRPSRPLKHLAAAVLGVGLLGAAYSAGMYFPFSSSTVASTAPPPSLQPGQRIDLTARLQSFDFDGAVATLSHASGGGAPPEAQPLRAIVDTLHGIVLDYIAGRYGLTDEQRLALRTDYLAEHSDLTVEYRQMLGDVPDSLAPARPELVTYEAYNSVNEFVSLFSGQVCGMIHVPGRFLLKHLGSAAGHPEIQAALDLRLSCRQILDEVVTPIASGLRERAVIQDLNRSKLTIDTHVRRMIAELATAEERVTADFEDAYTARFLMLRQTATLQARTQGTVKVGFDLNSRFSTEIDHERRAFIIRLPEPKILSTEVEVEFTDVENHMLVSIDRQKYNAALVRAREMVREAVQRSGVFAAARRNAEHVLLSIFQPVMSLPQFGYDVYVQFPSSPPSLLVQKASG